MSTLHYKRYICGLRQTLLIPYLEQTILTKLFGALAYKRKLFLYVY